MIIPFCVIDFWNTSGAEAIKSTTALVFVLDKLNKKVPWDTVWVENGEHSLYWSDREFVKKQLNKFVDSFQPAFLKD